MNTLTVKIGFDRELPPTLLDGFIAPLAAELQGAWRISQTLVRKVRRAEAPDPFKPSSDLFVTITFDGETTASRMDYFTSQLRSELTKDGDKKEAWGMGTSRVIAVANMNGAEG